MIQIGRFLWVWPAMIVLSTVGTSLVTFVYPQVPLRPIIIMWFLFFCPGMTVVPFFRLREVAVVWTLVLALSFVIDALVAVVLLYSGWWSPAYILAILLIFCYCGAIVQIITLRAISPAPNEGANGGRPAAL